jgi:hypothetical protein
MGTIIFFLPGGIKKISSPLLKRAAKKYIFKGVYIGK